MANSFNQLYSKKVLEHVRSPQNMGEIKDASGVATVGNPVCGDMMRFYIKVEKKGDQEYLKDVKFQTLGCGAAIATSSIVTTLVKGQPLSLVEKISKQTIIDALGGLPPVKIHCSVLADEGLKMAILDYRKSLKK